MRSGNYIQALGRQSFQPSQPASTSSPNDEMLPSEQANERQRELIKAQNDVLATVGVCLRDNKQHYDKTENRKAEDEAGLCVEALDLTVTYLAIWPLVGIRNRLQTYRVYEGMRYRDVLQLAWTRSTWEEMFSGMPAHLLFQMSNLTRDYLRTMLKVWLEKRSFFRHPITRRPRRRGWLYAIEKCVGFATWFLVYPVWYHSNLQVLHLVGSRPFFPTLASFVAFSAASPVSPPIIAGPLFSLATGKSLLYQAATSYFLQSFVTQTISLKLQNYFYHRLMSIIPDPTHGKKPTAFQGINNDRMSIDIEMSFEAVGPSALTIEDMANSSHAGGYTATIPFDPVTGDIITPSPEVTTDPLELDETDSEASRPPSPHPGPPRRASSLAQHQQQEAEEEEAENERRRQEWHNYHANTNRIQHRITTLSGHPADIAASHATECITTAIMLVTESVMLRTLARGVLAARGLHGFVYPPLQLFGAGQGLIAKALVAGEWAAMWFLFEVSWITSTAVGVRWFGYARAW